MIVESHIPEFMDSIKRRNLTAMRATCSWLVEALEMDLSGPSPSAPGAPPGLESGAGRDALCYQIVGDTGRVGVEHKIVSKVTPKGRVKDVNPGIYMIAHDKGTVRNVAQRPWLMSAVAKFAQVLRFIYKSHF